MVARVRLLEVVAGDDYRVAYAHATDFELALSYAKELEPPSYVMLFHDDLFEVVRTNILARGWDLWVDRVEEELGIPEFAASSGHD